MFVTDVWKLRVRERESFEMEVKREECIIRKGPWKTEEDEVLLNHVNKYGPRDWSSIRSKGLLDRTGKSCRLRWVNKLRPNLKKYIISNPISLFCLYVYDFLCICMQCNFLYMYASPSLSFGQ